MRSFVLSIIFLVSTAVILFNCQDKDANAFLNTIPGNAQYVGMETCKSCHYGIYETFMQTGMGQSWGLASKEKSAADFTPSNALVYDSVKNFYYKPFWDGDSLCILEFRLLNGDTVHQRLEKVSYIVGSGQHTNSHILNINGYLHQAPITFYTQKGKWDLAPGFEKGMNTRFDRKIEMECISCHNGYPGFVDGSLNKYTNVPLGIDCERCHGPGSLHVTQKQQGKIVDTSTQTDYTIVNPRKLSIEQQNNLCQRCHLQGIAVLNDGSKFDDFLPSNELSKTMNIFMPTYSGSENHMIMASHVERMKMSDCFVTSAQMSCITCHNPHVSVKFTPQEQYINACKSCHGSKDGCTERQEIRNVKSDNCITCHMPKNGSIDIPHVAVTDHFIRRKPAVENADEIATFIGMTCYNNNKVDDRTMAKAYLEFYERYEPSKAFIDSAFLYVEKAGLDKEKSYDPEIIRANYLLEAYDKVITLASALNPAELNDAWTCYRIGESYLKTRQYVQSIPFLQRATSLKPLALDFLNKLGNAYIGAGRNQDAKKVFQQIISEHPKQTAAYASLGYLMMQEQRFDEAAAMLQQSIMLDPDQLQVLINLAVVYHQKGADVLVKPLLWKALAIQPDNQQVKAMLADLN